MEARELTDFVHQLKSQKIIKKDIEVADATGFNKASLSNFLNGRVPISEKFERVFLEKYKRYLKEANKVLAPIDCEHELAQAQKEIALLTDHIKTLKKMNSVLEAFVLKSKATNGMH